MMVIQSAPRMMLSPEGSEHGSGYSPRSDILFLRIGMCTHVYAVVACPPLAFVS